jgi:hypothetical protein
MNDIERAINVISNLKHLIINIIGNEINEKEFDTTISALEKQIPKKVTYDYGLNEIRCPRCNIIFCACEEDETEDMYYAPYCYECGQCLDWEVENEWY